VSDADWLVPALAAHSDRLARAYGVSRRLERRDAVALTFDDGPHPEGTPAVLAELRRCGARATFFFMGEQVRRSPDVARAVADEGHEIALHGDRHTLLLRRRVASLAADLDRAAESIAGATGKAPALYRPPYGVFSSGALRHVRARGLEPWLWSSWGRDWERRATAESIARRVVAHLVPGAVVLLHDSDAYSSAGSWRRTAAALPSILDAAAALGVSVDSVTQST
jgi:peptidoglycan/xylan/chitin deacetylase (PgdA/CDA1 family)